MLVSAVNMLLRDEEFDSLEELCFNFDTTADKVKKHLQENGYIYSEEQKQFRPAGFDTNADA